MASNLELESLLINTDYISRVTIACLKKADVVNKNIGSTPGKKAWALDVIQKVIPKGLGVQVLTQLLLDNESASLATIQGVLNSDSQVQTRVNTYLDTVIANL